MAKSIHLRLTGEAEQFMEEMGQLGLTEADVIARSIYLLRQVWKTQRVALIKKGVGRDIDAVEYFFGINVDKEVQVELSSTGDIERVLTQKSKREMKSAGSILNEDVVPDE